jgi:multiple sugar transport system ATP-binding protein
MAQLVLDSVSKTYRPRGKEPVQAVKRVGLDVKDGEIVALLGSSGCGKTACCA